MTAAPRLVAALAVAGLLVACGDGGSGGGGGGGDRSATAHEPGDDERPRDRDREAVECPADERAAVTEGEPTALEDVTDAQGLVEPLVGMFGHAAATGDVDGDGRLDLFVGTFADRPDDRYQQRGAEGPGPDRLLLGGADGFTALDGFDLEPGRTSGAAFADLDGDGDLDLVVARNRSDRPVGQDGGDDDDGRAAAASAPSLVLENDGTGGFSVVQEVLAGAAARGIGVLDADRDGRLDLFVATDAGDGPGSALLRNEGGMRFRDVSEAAGVPADLRGLAVVAADLDADGETDVLVPGDPRVLRGDGAGGFDVVSVPALEWERYGDEDLVAGADVGDLDGDGRIDLVVGHHFGSTDRGCAVPVRVYLGRGEPGTVAFADVTEEVGVPGFSAKAPHVELVDLDDDGRLDVLTTASADGGDTPAVLRNVSEGGELRFEAPPGLGEAAYWVTGATGDFDGDGDLDVFAVENDPARPSRLWRGLATGGAIEVAVPLDATGVGAVVEVYEAGAIGDTEALLARREVVVGRGYAAGGAGVVHVGIGERAAVDVLVRSRDGTERRAEGVAAGTRLADPADFAG